MVSRLRWGPVAVPRTLADVVASPLRGIDNREKETPHKFGLPQKSADGFETAKTRECDLSRSSDPEHPTRRFREASDAFLPIRTGSARDG